jgi:carboxyl-terminal processing protease
MQQKASAISSVALGVAVLAAFGAGYGANEWRASASSGWAPSRPSPASTLIRTADGNLAQGNLGDPSRPRAYKPDLKPYETLEEVRQAIKENFVKTKVDDTQLTYGAVRGMLRALDDRFTRFLTPEEYDDFNERNSAEFTGIGARIDIKDDYRGGPQSKPFGASRPYIFEPIEGSPAAKAGIKKNDVILEINGKSTADMSDEATVASIRGVRGTTVKIKVERNIPAKDKKEDDSRRDGSAAGTFEVLIFEIKRDLIEMHPVKLEWMPGNIAWLRLDEFNKKTDAEVGNALREVAKGRNGAPAKGMILDMRNNPGGLLDSAVDVGSRFISTGPIVWTRERNGVEKAYSAERNRFLNWKVPTVVLINRYSASAAEIVTGALKDRDLATVVGETTFGKASVQVLVELKNGGALVITTAKYLTPKKVDISEKGISPDITVKSSDEDDKTGRGAQLQKAVSIINEGIGKAQTTVAKSEAKAD